MIAGCDQPAARCHIHHVEHWEHGGRTALANLALVCPRHHREIHLGIWALTMLDGVPYGIAPPWIDPDRRPLRNTTRQRCDQARVVGDQLRLAVQPVEPIDPVLPGEVAR